MSRHTVVINDEEQYSVWPSALPVPAGWRPVAEHDSREEALAHVETVWTDLRPASAR
ncbi:MbtH family NRPS accessory protein [Actinosynnema sp. NPDC020468]|uniref:MbtH family protein n=1 Tax=Actinosynnema sp. NPDC020468 TaxID=3154488 RepID=UPI0033F85885